MAIPQNREQFKQYCLRRIGAPVIEINIDDDQVEDRIDEALTCFWDYHFEGSEKTYYKYQVQPQDIQNKYITMPVNIIGVVNIFPIGESLSSNNLFNIRYQIALNDLYDLTAASMVPFYSSMQYIQFLEQMLVGMQPLRFNRYNNILYLDMDWGLANPGDFLLVEAYQVVDPNVYTGAWGDRWLIRYTTALIKRQWASNLIKFKDVSLPGGMKFNADKLYDDSQREIEQLEQELITSWSLPSVQMYN